MKKITAKSNKQFFDTMTAILAAGIGPGEMQKAYVGNDEIIPAPAGRRHIEFKNITIQHGAVFDRLGFSDSNSFFFDMTSRIAKTFETKIHDHYGTKCYVRDGSVYGCMKWNLGAFETTNPYAAVESLLRQLQRAILPSAYAKCWAKFQELVDDEAIPTRPILEVAA